jgi:environmental stress-induced protein Ves
VTHLDNRELRILVGQGLGLRDAGRAGRPCGPHAAARFVAEDVVHITSDYGDFDVQLDPKSGRPVNPMGPTCSG